MKNSHAHISLLILAIVTTMGVILLYGYMYYAVNASFTRAALARSVVNAQKASSQQAQSTAVLYEKTIETRKKIDSFFIAEGEAVSFIEDLEQLGSRVGGTVSLTSVSADDTSTLKAGSYGRVSAKVDATGSWSSVMRALMLSEVLRYQSSIDNIRMDVSSQNDGKNSKKVWRLSYGISASVPLSASTTAKTK